MSLVCRVSNANIYLEGGSLLGQAEEIKLPDVTAKMTEQKALGQIGAMEFPSGFEKMEGEIKWNSFYPEAMKAVGNPWKFVKLQARAHHETYTDEGRTDQKPLVTFLTVAFKKNALGTMKQNDTAAPTSGFACYAIRQTLGGEELLVFDVLANTYSVGGQDLMAQYKTSIG
uniref:Phage major tail tube protein n=1 Tax=Candidatus Kentrum sp. LPFa TaxID=2126335 RepID=A0A450WK77_9GAMM|nr:MAG: hypothetical protein BECKLPF1236B_GA0070989_111714 [Candidatus Kentron sp. LPFa]